MKYLNVFLQTVGITVICFCLLTALTSKDYLEIGLVTIGIAGIYALFSLLAIEEEKKYRIRKEYRDE